MVDYDLFNWMSHVINYLILLAIFLKSFVGDYINLFDMMLSVVGLMVSVFIFILSLKGRGKI